MLCYTVYNTSSWTNKVLWLFYFSWWAMPMQVLRVAAVMMMQWHDDGHQYLRSISQLGEHHQAYHDKDDIVAIITTTHTHNTRALQAGNRTRNRYGEDECDPAWERKYQAYLNMTQQVWTDPICYSYELSLSCYCPAAYTRPMRLEVYNDTVTHYEFVNQDPSISAVAIPEDRLRPTMNRLFQIAYNDCFEGCPDNGKAQECFITYDSVNGHMESLFIDYSKLAADDELVSIV
jgi:hypothetical protein